MAQEDIADLANMSGLLFAASGAIKILGKIAHVDMERATATLTSKITGEERQITLAELASVLAAASDKLGSEATRRKSLQ